MSDLDDALALYSLLAGTEADGTERSVIAVIPGPPFSKSRARYARGRVYSNPADVVAERRTATYLQQAVGGKQFPGNVAVGCIFYRPNFQRIDTDNLLKHVCDSATGVVWKDDSQVTAIYGRLELDRDNPRTVIVLGAHQSTLLRGVNDYKECGTCGQPVKFDTRRRREANRYCSTACSSAARTTDLDLPAACAHCGENFRRRTTAQRFCSSPCRYAARIGAPRKNSKPLSNCTACGVQLAHRRGGRCRPCWRTNPSRRAA